MAVDVDSRIAIRDLRSQLGGDPGLTTVGRFHSYDVRMHDTLVVKTVNTSSDFVWDRHNWDSASTTHTAMYWDETYTNSPIFARVVNQNDEFRLFTPGVLSAFTRSSATNATVGTGTITFAASQYWTSEPVFLDTDRAFKEVLLSAPTDSSLLTYQVSTNGTSWSACTPETRLSVSTTGTSSLYVKMVCSSSAGFTMTFKDDYGDGRPLRLYAYE